MQPPIQIRGAAEHNLVGVDLDLASGAWTAVTGISGSGKTSLVFDTLVREGRRRFLSAWSPRARAALGKLGAAEVDALEGLPVPLAVGADRLARSDRSTVGTLTGLADLLRLIYARDGSAGPQRRSAFSFNSSGACEACGGLGSTEVISRAKLVVHPERSIRDGALGPTLANGYTVYSQVTLEVMDTLCQAYGFTVDTPWSTLDATQQGMIFEGTTRLTVPFGKHSLESRLKWEGITARPREEGHYRGLIPVMSETLKRSRNPNILRYASSEPCAVCSGSRLGAIGRTSAIGGVTLPTLAALPLRELGGRLDSLTSPVLDAMREPLRARLEQVVELGLGHLALERTSTTLADGELQRLRLSSQLGLELGGMLLAFDEPTLGLHPEAHPGLERAFRRLLDLGNTVVTVEHHPHFVTAADRWVQLGPGGGSEGGRITANEPMPAAPLGPVVASARGRTGAPIHLTGARLHGLNTDLELHRGVLNVVCGPSGAGKTSLVFGTLLPALKGEDGGPFRTLDGAAGLKVVALDAKPLGRTPRSTPATYTGLFDTVRSAFAALPEASAAGLTASHFSHNHAAGRCPVCEGLGIERVGLHLMRDVERPCEACGGGRYRPEVLEVRWHGWTVAELLQASVGEARQRLAGEAIEPMLEALDALGLGYLQLGRSTTSISRGEAQRIRLATLLGSGPAPSVVLLDEPDRGLHPVDLERLLVGLQALVDQGHTLVAISHHPTIWAAADRLIEVRQGRAAVRTGLQEPAPHHRSAGKPLKSIELRGVRTHNLQDVDLSLPHGKLTVICGRSGSGKSSLAMDTLAAEAQRRFAETLPFQVRRFLRRVERPVLQSATGLTPTVVLEQRVSVGSTVATVAGLGPLLRLLYARDGTLDGQPIALLAEHFARSRAAGRCPSCAGAGTVRRCDPALLVGAPTKSIRDGALGTTKPGRFFTELDGRHLALLGAAGGEALLDTPWQDLTPAQQALALHGAPEPVKVRWRYQRGKRTGEHVLEEPWTGFVALVEAEATLRVARKDAEAWFEPFQTGPCGDCDGTGLQAPARRVVRDARTLTGTLALQVGQLAFAPSERVAPVLDRIHALLAGLKALSLGHLRLDAPIASLSSSELQRLRLAEVLHSELVGLTLVLDEPDAGLDAAGTAAMLGVLRDLVARGNTAVVVSHAEAVIRAADHVVELEQGRVLEVGPPAAVLAGDGPTARGFRSVVTTNEAAPTELEWLGYRLPQRGVVVVTGASGSGKSRLLEAFAGCAAGVFGEVITVHSARARTVGDALDWMKPVQARFHRAHPEVPARAFSPHSPAGRCPACAGSGVEKVSLDILADLELPCPVCEGRRFLPAILACELDGRTIAAVLEQPLGTLGDLLPKGGLVRAEQLGLAHLALGTRLTQLSGGELQRLAVLGLKPGSGRLLLLDAPDRGLHALDLPGLIAALHDLGRRDLVVLATQRARLARAFANPIHL